MNTTKKIASGSVKVDPKALKDAKKHCKTNGVKLSFFVTEAIKEKLEKSANGN